jgi:hypothetical protein
MVVRLLRRLAGMLGLAQFPFVRFSCKGAKNHCIQAVSPFPLYQRLGFAYAKYDDS